MAKENNLAAYLFHQGTNYRAYDYLGVHREDTRYAFRVWAPNAEAVFAVGDFNGWEESDPLTRITPGGIWEGYVSADRFGEGSLYKFKLHTKNGERYKADPYARFCQKPPETASVYFDADGYAWRDAGYLSHRAATMTAETVNEQPINIYEVHLGSWRRHEDGTAYTYRETAEELAPYLKQMGYTHVELMPVMEHPFDGSWGYQICGYFAPTARFGTPTDFKAFVDKMHSAGIGVILDWVPAHFPKDAHGLYEFDGQPLYEYQGADRMEHKNWGTRCFDVGREEVQCFLISNALFWMEKYHADGLRVDAVASMLYLDYDREPGEWTPNIYGNNRNLEAIAFFRKLNRAVSDRYPDVMMIAEESTAWSDVTTFDRGGLGFTFKWNMGWMNDTLAYAATDPLFRKYNHNNLTFSMTYAFSERYVLPISHDEVVHGKKSFLDKMPGEYGQKFAGERVFLTYMMTHPGKKLMFMGSEIGQFREWDFAGSIEWFLLDYEMHAKMQHFTAALGQLYLRTPALWEKDGSWDGFSWIDADNRDQSILSYVRRDGDGREVVVILNFTPVTRTDFRQGLPLRGVYEELLNSDAVEFGGSGVTNGGEIRTEDVPFHGCAQSAVLTIPPLGGMILARRRAFTEKEEAELAAKNAAKTAGKPAAKKATAKKPAAAKPATKKTAATAKPAAKSAATAKPAAKKTAATAKPAAKKPTAKKAAKKDET